MSWYNPASWFRSEGQSLRDAWYGGDPLGAIIRAEMDGVHVSSNSAMRLAAYFACLRVRSETMSLLPWRVYEYAGNNDELRTRQRQFERILRYPNPETTGPVFWQTMELWKAHRGNAFAEIVRNGLDEPVALYFIQNDRVQLDRIDGRLVYKVANNKVAPTLIQPRNMLHLRGPSADGLNGLSIIDIASTSIESGMQSDAMKRAFYKNGTFLAGQVVRSPGAGGKDLDKDVVKNMMSSIEKRFSGVSNSFKLAYLDAGHEIKPLQMSMRDSQFIETTTASITEICRWFRMPPHKICETTNLPYNQRESAETAFVNDCISPSTVTTQAEVSAKLLPDGVEARLDLRGLLRGDLAARTAYFQSRFNTGSLSPDEIRAIEDEDPLTDGRGTGYYIPLNMAPLGPDGRPIAPEQTGSAP